MDPHAIEFLFGINIRIEPEKGCWFIRKDWSHYATIGGKKAHRLIYELKEPIKPGHEICHTCDRKGCINPEHLFQGTHSDNMRDALNKGRLSHLRLGPMSKEEKNLRERARWMQLGRFCK